MFEPSASMGQLAEHCGHLFTSYTEWPDEPTVGGSDLGTCVHRGAEAAVRGDDTCLDATGLDNEDAVSACRHINRIREFLNSETYEWTRAELVLAYHVESGRVREKGSRHDPKEIGERTAIIDMAAQCGPGYGLVLDWKTGRQKYLREAADSWQLGLGAVSAAEMFGWNRVRVAYGYVSASDIIVDAAELDAWALEEWAERFREQRRRLTKGPMPPTPGPWCTQYYCPLRGQCDATKAALARVAPPDHPALAEVGGVYLTPIQSEAEAVRIYEALPKARAVLKQYGAVISSRETEIKAWALRGGLSLGNGKRVVVREQIRRDVRIETDEQVEALRSVLGDAGTEAAVQVKRAYEANGDSINEGARIAAKGMKRGAIKRLTAKVMAKLGEAGAIRKGSFTKLDEIEEADDVSVFDNTPVAGPEHTENNDE